MEAELVLASSPIDAGISCWDLHSGAEHLRFRSCSSPPNGLTNVAGRFLASSQIRESKSSGGSIFYWSWNKPHVEVKSFPAEPIKPLIANSDGTYLVGGGLSGDIYLWEVATGMLLKKWHAHYRAVSCLVFSDDQSLLISGSEDGSVRVWSLLMIFDDLRQEAAKHLYEHSFSEHTLKVTHIVTGYGGCNAIIVSASEDRTCKIWSLSRGKLLRDIVFPSVIEAIALDPGEHVFYAGGRDGKIYIAALNAQVNSSSTYGMHIIGTLSEQSKAITSLALSKEGFLLASGAEDGMVRVWDTRTRNITRVFRHAKGPISNVLVTRQPLYLNPRASMDSFAWSLQRHVKLPPPLEKFSNSSDERTHVKAFIGSQINSNNLVDSSYVSFQAIENQIKELQQQGSSAAKEMEIERLKLECKRSMQMVRQWKKMYEDLHNFSVSELLDGNELDNANGQRS
ncbi:hypothetical protein M9H77_25025 [Catharanthus roseus]|uniref:Uncharacterized protein n=1 Tax=Catharanthus roseus TaxID=4058 RepID=A0ACC0A5S2_CATRO|nr:hypothetical protein M9H77_25025 [Catharanthus roseus]